MPPIKTPNLTPPVSTIRKDENGLNPKENVMDLEKFRLAVEKASDHIVITDDKGIIIYANPAVEDVTGYKPSEVVGKKAGGKNLWGGQMPKEFYKQMWDTLKIQKKTFVGEITNKKKNGAKYIASAKISPILDKNNKPLFYVGIERDITKEREVDRMKTEFISLASHQLRTPLSSIKWFLEILLDGDAGKLNKEQKDYIKSINDSNERMIALINTLLDITRIESGKILIDPEPTNLAKLIGTVLEELEIQLKVKEIKLTVSVKNNLPKVNIDKKLIRNVYINLLTNSIKYTPKGGKIRIILSTKENKMISQISDTGKGIPKEEQEKVFQKFYRGKNILKGDTDGTGLGLYLVKAIIDSSGGETWFESEENKGTSFWFSLPIEGNQEK